MEASMFQSPCGDQIFGNIRLDKGKRRPSSVSVPLRGLDIRKHLDANNQPKLINVSVPLRGLDIRKLSQTLTNNTSRFQSPCGDQIFGNRVFLDMQRGSCLVSVPLRGLDIRKPINELFMIDFIVSFSPLAGIRYSETQADLNLARTVSVFQSPCGDQIFGNKIEKARKEVLISVSVPLRGLDIRKPFNNELASILNFCFSPLAGIRYSETFICC